MFEFIGVTLLILASGGIGFYLGQRGWEGVHIDLANAERELKELKDKLSGKKISK